MARSAIERNGRGRTGGLAKRHDPLTGLVMTVPVFLVYHLGILLVDLRNGADLVTGVALALLDFSSLAYVAVTLAFAAGIVGAAAWLRGRSRIEPRELVPVLLESLVLAMLMAFTVGLAVERLFAAQVGPRPLGPLEKLVMACGAGFHEELLFRVVLFGGGVELLRRVGRSPLRALLVAGVVSSLLFSAAHYVGSLGDALRATSFVFRFLSGAFLAAVYRLRGFAVAVYTHTLYDLLVFFVL